MENPACWNEIQKTIHRALKQHDDDVEAGLIGSSDVMYVYHHLKAGGYLNEPAPDYIKPQDELPVT